MNRQRRKAETDLGRDEFGFGCCWRCGRYTYVNGHERLRRTQGGDFTNPDCLLCVPCNQWAAQGDIPQAVWDGWSVMAHKDHPVDPELEPWQARNLAGEIVTFA